jgi:hypothetical protein
MNAKTDRWESYTDKAGRQHWRWPAANEQLAVRLVDAEQRHDAGLPRSQQADLLPQHNRGK